MNKEEYCDRWWNSLIFERKLEVHTKIWTYSLWYKLTPDKKQEVMLNNQLPEDFILGLTNWKKELFHFQGTIFSR